MSFHANDERHCKVVAQDLKRSRTGEMLRIVDDLRIGERRCLVARIDATPQVLPFLRLGIVAPIRLLALRRDSFRHLNLAELPSHTVKLEKVLLHCVRAWHGERRTCTDTNRQVVRKRAAEVSRSERENACIDYKFASNSCLVSAKNESAAVRGNKATRRSDISPDLVGLCNVYM